MEDCIIVNTDGLSVAEAGNDLYRNRAVAARVKRKQDIEVSIIIQAYNRVEKTRRCVESILRNVRNISYELILIDNGSTDGTLDYFRSVPYAQKTVFHFTKNVGSGYPNTTFSVDDISGDFIITFPNDLIMTERCLENLLACAKSDPRIGMVVPVSSNVSNFQQVDLDYADYEDMQRKAAAYNRSDPSKWEDRLRLITLGPLYRREVLMCLGWPLSDTGFFHDFGDDDVTFAVRRAGYRTVLARDTWICHDHDFRNGEGKDPEEFQRSLEIGRKNFRDKYFGVDPWEDVNNFLFPVLQQLPPQGLPGKARVLGVDVRCGTPILDVKNWLRTFGVFDTELSAFTQDPKYWIDLKTVCDGIVDCDREEFMADAFPRNYFDYIVADYPLNRYHEPQKLLSNLFSLCKQGGTVICRLKNTYSFRELLNMFGQREVYDPEFSYAIPLEAAYRALEGFGEIQFCAREMEQMDEESVGILRCLLPEELSERECDSLTDRLLTGSFVIAVRKK